MKKFLLTIFACGSLALAHSQIVTIPNSNFKSYLLNHQDINTNFDDEIQVAEALSFTDSIICSGMQINDLTGIEAFENIIFLSCTNNQLTSLDVSHNTALQSLICAMNSLSSLDVSSNVYLRNLRCSMNPIYSLNISNNPDLEYLYCESNNLSSLDVSQNPDLIELYCTNNSIQTLNLIPHTSLIELDCSSNPLNQLDFAPIMALQYIMCNGSQLPSITLTSCPNLVTFRGVGGTYTELNLYNCPNLERFDCPFTQLTSLDFSENPQLKVVYCFSSQLTSLNIANGHNDELELLWVSNNQLNCIKVDNAAYSEANWTGNDFAFDPGVSFDENCVAALNHLEKPTLELYPNPATTTINIETPEKMSYKLISTDGSTIATGEFPAGNNSFSTESLPVGVYFFDCVGSTTGRIVQKFQKTE